jgi:hypothetical protein
MNSHRFTLMNADKKRAVAESGASFCKTDFDGFVFAFHFNRPDGTSRFPNNWRWYGLGGQKEGFFSAELHGRAGILEGA